MKGKPIFCITGDKIQGEFDVHMCIQYTFLDTSTRKKIQD